MPSSNPFISRNCLRTSTTIAFAACPTARMARAENKNGIIPPMKSPARTFALEISMTSNPVISLKAANRANEVSAAEAIANPLPMAAVVFPTVSRISVFSRTSFGR